jgi:hypothetical protein
MAVVIGVERNIDSVIKAFAQNDVLPSHLDAACTESEDGMEPGDDYFTAPFALYKGKLKLLGKHAKVKLYLIFTAYKCRQPHSTAVAAMKGFGKGIRVAGSVNEFAEDEDPGLFKFRKYAWVGGDDVCLDLEDKAISVTCEKLGLEVPSDWRTTRSALVEKHKVGKVFKLEQHAGPPKETEETETEKEERAVRVRYLLKRAAGKGEAVGEEAAGQEAVGEEAAGQDAAGEEAEPPNKGKKLT